MRLRTPEAEVARVQRQSHGSLFASGQMYSRKTLQLPPRPGGATRTLVGVQLHDLIPCNCSSVLNVNGCGQRSIGTHRRGVDLEIGKLEAGIAEPVTDGAQRSTRVVPVAGVHLLADLGHTLCWRH